MWLTIPIHRALSARGLVQAIGSPSGAIVRKGGWVTVPPIRFTPSEMRQIADDYFFEMVDLSPGDVVVDVGCGMGTEFVGYFERIGPTGKVVAIEAHPRSYEIAVCMKHLNNTQNITILHAAAWSTDEVLEISDDSESLGINSVVDPRLLAGPTFRVKAVKVDSIEAVASEEIALLKINVEGAELHVLEGASETLKRTRQVIVACHDFLADSEQAAAMRTLDSAIARLESLGFQIARRPNHPLPAVRDTLYASREVKR